MISTGGEVKVSLLSICAKWKESFMKAGCVIEGGVSMWLSILAMLYVGEFISLTMGLPFGPILGS